jgi:thermostable 8-oxoguanine DNA glycosylase
MQKKIATILEQRRIRLPQVQQDIERWACLDQEIGTLKISVDELPNLVAWDDLKQALAEFRSEDIRKDIAKIIELLRVLEARYSRKTINIGVSGRARVGKSTLLQAISGLEDEQIPTGSGIPVTAVRSRIFHSTTQQRATITLHTFSTFLDEVLRPYHDELGLEPPVSAYEFRVREYPTSENEISPDYRDKHTHVTILRRLREMQESFPTYEPSLIGGEKTIPLNELRQYVAYPSNEEINAGKVSRLYLAVSDVRIECSFPKVDVDHLGIIDLPGLGELAANTEEHHLAGLKNEVDVVLLVKRPVEGMAYWGKEDGAATNLLDEARGFIKKRGDFVFIVVNSDGSNSQLETSLRDDLRRNVNDGEDGRHYHVLEGNALQQESVYRSILSPVLEHLAERLPNMDKEIFDGTIDEYRGVTAKTREALRGLEIALNAANYSSGNSAEKIEDLTQKLYLDISAELSKIVQQLRALARVSDEDSQYIDAVENAYTEIKVWIDNGFGKGQDAWCKDALRRMLAKKGSSGFTEDALNQIRVEISKRYCALDHYFHAKVSELWGTLAQVFTQHLGLLLQGTQGVVTLDQFAHYLADASEPCPTLSQAVNELVALKLDYRTQLHPLVRRELDDLNQQVTNPETDEAEDQFVVKVSEDGAEELLRELSKLALQASYRTKKALMQQADIPALVLHAAAEQFEDVFIRDAASNKELRRLTRSFRDEIWPGVFHGIAEENARYTKIKKTIIAIETHLNVIKESDA